ncbi:hypothetical protein [Variovorax rhizosphaerae]|uniref:Uncharacterized protein n=1 Tax=Variovorax rhizosphaerae TaxID=1836200 RepID=A0ABU8WG25_9BURK
MFTYKSREETLIRNAFLAAGIAALALLTGCVGPVPRIEAAPAKLTEIKTIAVVRTPEPKTYTVMNIGHPGTAFGLVGGLIAAADQISKTNTLSKAYQDQGTSTSAALTTEVVGQLKAQGYTVNEQDAPWNEKDGRFSLQFDQIQSDADAVLVIAPTLVGFVSPQNSTEYLPTVTAVATLLGKDRANPLYRGFHSVGWRPTAEGWRNRLPKTTYPNFSALMTDTRASADALNGAAADVASSVAVDLKRSSRMVAAN